MKKNRIIIYLLCIILLFFSNGIVTYALDENSSDDNIVLIDPGHGGVDGGAKSKNGTIEKNINLSIALKLKADLEEKGYKVFMTREDDVELGESKVKDLTERCKMKRDTNCDIFVSIHQNMFQKPSCFGAQVWYADNAPSKLAADCIQNSLKNEIKNNNKRIAKCAKDNYKILRDKYDGASIIVECGFLSNSNEEENLKSDAYQQQLADSIALGIEDFFEVYK